MKYEIYIPKEIVSGNTLAYRHWRTRMKDRDTWVAFLLALGQSIPRAATRRHVTVTAYRKRRVDEDNLSSGFKHGRDAMVRVGLLIDDNKAGCKFTYNDCKILSEMPATLRVRHGLKPLTIIEIEDI